MKGSRSCRSVDTAFCDAGLFISAGIKATSVAVRGEDAILIFCMAKRKVIGDVHTVCSCFVDVFVGQAVVDAGFGSAKGFCAVVVVGHSEDFSMGITFLNGSLKTCSGRIAVAFHVQGRAANGSPPRPR